MVLIVTSAEKEMLKRGTNEEPRTEKTQDYLFKSMGIILEYYNRCDRFKIFQTNTRKLTVFANFREICPPF